MTNMKNTGFTPPADIATGSKRGSAAIAALVMVVTLTLGTLAAATVVSFGIARGSDNTVPHTRAYAIDLMGGPQHRG